MSDAKIALPIPEPLRGADPDSFAHHSVVRRLPEIAKRTIKENDFPEEVISKIEIVITEIPDGHLRQLDDPDAPDSMDWDLYLSRYVDHNWLEVPWIFAEFYFYRRILEASGFFRFGDHGFQQDPYHAQKIRGYDVAKDRIGDIATFVEERIRSHEDDVPTLQRLLGMSLWGNQADLSMWPVEEGVGGERGAQKRVQDHMLVDHSPSLVGYLTAAARPLTRLDIVVDNAGFEFVTDLFLADYLLSRDLSQVVHLHPKDYPIFVSDVIPADLDWTFDFLGNSPSDHVKAIVDRLQEYLGEGRLVINNHLFWTSPLAMWEMPPDLYDELGRSELVLFKGDMNYRRLLGDRHWGYETPFEEIMSYFPGPVGAIRALKSEICCGLSAGQAGETAERDPEWMVNGNWGLIQFRA